MTQDPFAASGGTPDGDPFAAPAVIPSEYPTLVDLRGRLLMCKPMKMERGIPTKFKDASGVIQLQNRMTVDVHVIDGGPVGKFEGFSFTGMYISNERLTTQMTQALETGIMVLGRLDTMEKGKKAGAGNPWGFADPTEEDKQAARAFIAAGYKQTAQAAAAPPLYTPPAQQPVSVAPTGYNPFPAQQPQATVPAQVSSNPFG